LLDLIQLLYGPNASALYPEFVVEIREALERIESNESAIILRDFSTHVENGAVAWRW